MGYEVYLHGQILGTHSFLLKGEFVQPDEYAEIKQKYFLPGGETGTAATVLASLGAEVKMWKYSYPKRRCWSGWQKTGSILMQ